MWHAPPALLCCTLMDMFRVTSSDNFLTAHIMLSIIIKLQVTTKESIISYRARAVTRYSNMSSIIPAFVIRHHGNSFSRISSLIRQIPAFSIHVPWLLGFCHVLAETIGESHRGGTRRKRKKQWGKGESYGTDFTNKCRRLNPGMLQDGSFSLNHRLPAASQLPPCLAACCAFVSLWRTSLSPSLRPPCRFSRHFVLRGGASTSANDSLPVLGNLPHAYAAAIASLSPFSLLFSH